MPLDYSHYLIAVLIGLGSTGHCMMMCGGISSALAANLSNTNDIANSQKRIRLFFFHLGRIACYSFLALLVGSLLSVSALQTPMIIFVSRLLAAVFIMLIGFYVAGFSQALKRVEHAFAFIWRYCQPLVKHYLGMEKPYHALVVGFLWGFLPCGIIYSTLIWAATTAHGVQAAVLMFLFGVGTLPGLLTMSLLSHELMMKLKKRFPKKALGILLVLFGLWSLVILFFPLHNHVLHHFAIGL